MRFLVLSDIHANIDAFDAVLAHAEGRWDRALVLGDLVGYGAEPNLVIDRVRSLDPEVVIRGNHDKAACGLDDGSQFNHVARTAAVWTGGVLTPDNTAYLRALSDSYTRFFHQYDAAPVLVVDTEHLNPIERDDDFKLLTERIERMRGRREQFNLG